MPTQIEFLLETPFIKFFIDNFPLPLVIGVDNEIKMSNLSLKQLLPSPPLNTSIVDIQEIIGNIPDGLSHEKNTISWTASKKFLYAKNVYKIFCTKMSLGETSLILAIFLPQTSVISSDVLIHEKNWLGVENEGLKHVIYNTGCEKLGKSPKIHAVIRQALEYAFLNVNIVLYGEKGVGKSWLAHLIHMASKHHQQSFLEIECKELSSDKLTSILNSLINTHKASDAIILNDNYVTIYLKNIDQLNKEAQEKLLNFITQSTFLDAKTNNFFPAKVRVISSTTNNLIEFLRKGKFKEELFTIIYAGIINVPPLRLRLDDIKYFINLFFDRYALKGKKIPEILLKKYLSYSWPGNIYQLEKIIKNYVFYCINIEKNNINDKYVMTNMTYSQSLNIEECLDKAEKDCILRALKICNGRKEKAAELTGQNLRTFQRRCAKYGL